MSETRDAFGPLTIHFRPCRVCGALIGCLEDDLTPICQECELKPEPRPEPHPPREHQEARLTP